MTLINIRKSKDILNELTKDFDTFFSDMGEQYSSMISRRTATETEDDITINLTVPGYGKKDIDIDVIGDKLTIAAKENKDRNLSGFKKAYRISNDSIDVDNISAKCENGLLAVTVPKIVPEVVSRKIKIK